MKRILIVLLCFLFSNTTTALSDSPYLQELVLDLDMLFTGPECIVILQDGSIVVAGRFPGETNYDATMICFDHEGNELWRLVSEEGCHSSFSQLIAIADGMLVALLITDEGKQCIVHVNEGNIVYSEQLNSVPRMYNTKLYEAKQGYFTFTSNQIDADTASCYVEFRTSTGNVDWEYRFEDQSVSPPQGILSIADGYLLYGSIDKQDTEESLAMAMKLSDRGQMAWYLEIPGDNWPIITEAAQTFNGNILAIGLESRTVIQNEKVLSNRRFGLIITPDGNFSQEELGINITYLMPTSDGGFVALVAENNIWQIACLDGQREVVQSYPVQDTIDGTQKGQFLKSTEDAFYMIKTYFTIGMQKHKLIIVRIDPNFASPMI